MSVFYPHERLMFERAHLLRKLKKYEDLIDERAYLLRKLEKYEDLKMLDAWNDCWSRLSEINRILELNP